jgi:hypothetical protein
MQSRHQKRYSLFRLLTAYFVDKETHKEKYIYAYLALGNLPNIYDLAFGGIFAMHSATKVFNF